MSMFLAAATLLASQNAAAAAPPQLTPPQAQALRCGVVFAMGAGMQAASKPVARGWPALGTKGREYFVRVAALIIDETGASREAIQAMAASQAASLQDDAAVVAAMPGCLVLLDASGV